MRPDDVGSEEAAAAIGRSLSSPYWPYFDDEEISDATVAGQRCAIQAHTLFASIRNSLVPPREMWEFVSFQVRDLFAAVKEYQELLEGECGSFPHRDFAVASPISVSVGNVRNALSAHAAALELGQWVLDEIWDAVEGIHPCRPWHSLVCLPSDELDLKPVEQNYSAVMKHFQTLAPWDVDELQKLLSKEAILTAKAREAERMLTAALPTPPTTLPAEPTHLADFTSVSAEARDGGQQQQAGAVATTCTTPPAKAGESASDDSITKTTSAPDLSVWEELPLEAPNGTPSPLREVDEGGGADHEQAEAEQGEAAGANRGEAEPDDRCPDCPAAILLNGNFDEPEPASCPRCGRPVRFMHIVEEVVSAEPATANRSAQRPTVKFGHSTLGYWPTAVTINGSAFDVAPLGDANGGDLQAATNIVLGHLSMALCLIDPTQSAYADHPNRDHLIREIQAQRGAEVVATLTTVFTAARKGDEPVTIGSVTEMNSHEAGMAAAWLVALELLYGFEPSLSERDLQNLVTRVEMESARAAVERSNNPGRGIVRRPVFGVGRIPLGEEQQAITLRHDAMSDSGTVAEQQAERTEVHPEKDRERKPRMTVAEANEQAKKVAQKWGRGFFALSERKQAELIGCSWKTWTRTPLFQQADKKRLKGKPKSPSSPKTESLTAEREAVTGEGEREEVLENLIADHEADKEPSPLDTRPRKVHSRKRL